MVVIAHHRIGGDVNREQLGDFQQAILNPLPSVFKAFFTALAVLAPKKCATHAVRYAVIAGNNVEGYQRVAWSGHGALRSKLCINILYPVWTCQQDFMERSKHGQV